MEMNAGQALDRFKTIPDVRTVLDIGAGNSAHAGILREVGMNVITVSLNDYMQIPFPQMDGIWASHVLEHIPNVGSFLRKCYSELCDEGVLAITVPPLKNSIVGGHISLWNEGLLLYRLILAGFDCRRAIVGVYGYNISVIVRKVKANLPPLLMDYGDIERLAPFFPIPVSQGFDGRCGNIGWESSPFSDRGPL